MFLYKCEKYVTLLCGQKLVKVDSAAIISGLKAFTHPLRGYVDLLFFFFFYKFL